MKFGVFAGGWYGFRADTSDCSPGGESDAGEGDRMVYPVFDHDLVPPAACPGGRKPWIVPAAVRRPRGIHGVATLTCTVRP